MAFYSTEGGIFSNGSWTDIPMTVGAVYGKKTFNIDKYGRLISPTVKHVWTPGENVSNYDQTHHGFYAFTDDSRAWWCPGQVNGIIKGYGKTTEGTRGFTSEKAEIVALFDGTKRTKKRPITTLAAKRRMMLGRHNSEWWDFETITLGMTAILLYIFAIISLLAYQNIFIALFIPAYVFMRYSFSGFHFNYERAENYLSSVPSSLQKLYPNVKFYKSEQELLNDPRINKSNLDNIEPGSEEFWKLE